MARVPERVGSVVCDVRALSLRRANSVVVTRGLSCPVACGILVPRPEIEPTSPALEGRFFIYLYFYYYFLKFIFGCAGSSLLRAGFL